MRRGFSLVELVVAAAVAGVLAALALPTLARLSADADKARCLQNQKQIGAAILLFAQDHDGNLPLTTHTTGGFRRERAWIFTLAPYLEDVDEVRICPADPPRRRDLIRRTKTTSYVLNDLVFDSEQFSHLYRIPRPSQTLWLAILSESRAPSTTRDHIHGAGWDSFTACLGDIEPDRHRVGRRSPDRLKGSANYLYADGSARNISAREWKALFDSGVNPAAVPQ